MTSAELMEMAVAVLSISPDDHYHPDGTCSGARVVDRELWSAMPTTADQVRLNHPADDAEPVTAEWMRSLPPAFEPDHGCFYFEVNKGVDRSLYGDDPWYEGVVLQPSEGWLWLCDSNTTMDGDDTVKVVVPMAARGQVRRILAGLGIPLPAKGGE